MYHISDIKRFNRCERLYYFSKDSNNVFKPYLRSDKSINDVLVSYFDIETYFLGQRNDNLDVFFANVDKYEWFMHPRFADDELRINIPLMHKVDDGYDLYFINYGIQVKDIDLLTYRISTQVLNKLNITVKNIYLISFNGDYINDGTLNCKELLIVSDLFKNERIIDLVNKQVFDYKEIIEKINNLDIEKTKPCKNKHCRLNGLCEYYERCFPNEGTLQDDSILTLVSSAHKNEMYENGISLLKDVDIKLLEGNRVQYAQIMASKNNGLFVDKMALKQWLNKLDVRPISFIDFEWDRYLIPPYKNMKPLDVLCFEYALYYLDENGNMQHKTFVQTKDCREAFIQSMINDLPSQGPILAYNSDGAECLRLNELAKMFPEYKDKLDSINKRFLDLATPFLEGLVYDVRMKGNYTLKKLVEICSKYSYADLDIYNGMEAVYNWRDIDLNKNENEDEIIDELKQYCSLDAYGLFLVYKWLLELVV